MRQLFAERFAVPLIDCPDVEPKLDYDEARQLNVTSAGNPAVETGVTGRTGTLTHVRAEQDDFGRLADGDVGRLETTTKVRREGDDFARDALMLATETRQAPGERDDFACRELTLDAEIAVPAGAEDSGWLAHGRAQRLLCARRPTASLATRRATT
jgi:hypothetical protein